MFYLTTGVYIFAMIVFELFGSAEPPKWAIDNTKIIHVKTRLKLIQLKAINLTVERIQSKFFFIDMLGHSIFVNKNKMRTK